MCTCMRHMQMHARDAGTRREGPWRAVPASACSLYGPVGAPVLPSSTYHPLLLMVKPLLPSRRAKEALHHTKLKLSAPSSASAHAMSFVTGRWMQDSRLSRARLKEREVTGEVTRYRLY